MGGRRSRRNTMAPRYIGKMITHLRSRMPEDYARAVAVTSLAEYSVSSSIYEHLYEEMVKVFGKQIPRAQLGLYRAALFAMYRMVKAGYPVGAVIEKFSNPKEGGLDRRLLEEIARHFGLLRSSTGGSAGKSGG
ncbi:MAG: hypothetical protein LM564_06270 [Desulfurococcaceae archaeon]|nr:hypothetical protein [Desulfurococcaceae archaeon]